MEPSSTALISQLHDSTIRYPHDGHPAEAAAARALSQRVEAPEPVPSAGVDPGLRVFLGGAVHAWETPQEGAPQERPSTRQEWWSIASDARPESLPDAKRWAWLHVRPDGTGDLAASDPAFLMALPDVLTGGLTPEQHEQVRSGGLLLEASFDWNRSHYDYVLTQNARTTRHFDPAAYIRGLAETGMTHVEVNGLFTPTPFEPGVPDEYYNQFYTYCPGLNQFVDTPLTAGIYPKAYLRANLNRLKRLAAYCLEVGIRPGLLCFEPRSLPEAFFQQYPTLRGARIDHPFRSHLPRYTLAQDHPVTQKHYRALMRTLLEEVPALAYLSIWSNDSGAGFEHTSSLYVGRNGGPYMIREWRSHDEIADVAGESVHRFMRLLQEAGAEVNGDFEVLLRMEHFKTEHDAIMDGMGEGLSIEVPSLLVRGYDLPYAHPQYPDQQGAAGSIHHTYFEEREAELLDAHRAAGFEPSVNYAPGPGFNMEPLLGIPFPQLLNQKLTALRETGFKRVNALGGLLNTEATPYWPHPDIIRAHQYNPELGLATVLHRAATRWAGADHAEQLVGWWTDLGEAVSYLPIVPLYSHFGFVWLRTWVRPLVPDIEAIPQPDRRYYEQFMVSTPNNPNMNDLGQDVLFHLITQDTGQAMTCQFDDQVLPRLHQVAADIEEALPMASDEARPVMVDLQDRVTALRCWATTQRNTCAWVWGVHGYMEADTEEERARCLTVVQDMVQSETKNAEALLTLWNEASTEFMLVSDVGETAFIYGENFGDLLRTKIELMRQYGDETPHIDRDIIWRLRRPVEFPSLS
jgi:hypothetical protein